MDVMLRDLANPNFWALVLVPVLAPVLFGVFMALYERRK